MARWGLFFFLPACKQCHGAHLNISQTLARCSISSFLIFQCFFPKHSFSGPCCSSVAVSGASHEPAMCPHGSPFSLGQLTPERVFQTWICSRPHSSIPKTFHSHAFHNLDPTQLPPTPHLAPLQDSAASCLFLHDGPPARSLLSPHTHPSHPPPLHPLFLLLGMPFLTLDAPTHPQCSVP